jgi:RNA polymerase sigma-70 factor (ECF subfamily)
MDAARFQPAPASISPVPPDRQGETRDRTAEAELVARAQEGDRGAFEELYRSHVAGVARTVRYRLGRVDEDVVAEVFVRAWRALPRYRATGSGFGAWLGGICRHLVVDEFRARGRAVPVAEVPDRSVEPMTADLLALRDAIDLLPTEQRQIVELKYLVGLTNEEVAAALHTTPGAVNAKQWRALRALEHLLGDDR